MILFNKQFKASFIAFFFALVVFQACEDRDANRFTNRGKVFYDLAEIETPWGNMVFWLYDTTKLHKANFLELIESGFYDETEIHAIYQNLRFDGGDENSKDFDRTNDGLGNIGYTISQEIDTTLIKHYKGSLGALRKSDTENPLRESNGSIFYVVLNDSLPSYDGRFTVFGKLISNLNVLDSIENQKTLLGNAFPEVRIPLEFNVLKKTKDNILEEYGFDIVKQYSF